MKVLITGGSGLIGSRITSMLLNKNIEVVHLTRMPNSKFGIKTYHWDWRTNTIDENCLNGVTDIIHLAGTPIADKPWTNKRKHQIVASRVFTARLLFNLIEKQNKKLNSYISASGIGYYGAITTPQTFIETDPLHNDFIAKCCIYWEKSAHKISPYAQRTVILRTGIVLDKNKGALPKISKYIKKGIGSPLGTGKQAFPWIHISDIANLYTQTLLNPDYNGIYNAVAPQKNTNEEVTLAIAQTLKKKIRLPNVPPFVIKTLYSELSSLVLEGSHISPQKLINQGFQFQYPDIHSALKDIFP